MFLAALAAALPVSLHGQEPGPLRFAVSTERVRLDVFVGRGGAALPGLTAADFEVRDEGKPQELRLVSAEEAPLHAILVLDTSASVEGRRLDKLQAAAATFLRQLGPRDRATVLTFSHELRLRGDIATQPTLLAERLSEVVAKGTTSLNDATVAALLMADPQLGRGVVLVFSDGVDMLSWFSDGEVARLARHSEAVVYGVSPDDEARTGLVEALAKETGGRVFAPGSPDDLREPFLRILNEFRSRYLLEFEPASAKPGWRRLEVRLKGRKADIRARPGYYRWPVTQ